MWKRIVVILAIAYAAASPATVRGAPIGKAGHGELEGEWQATTVEVDGKAEADEEPLRIVIKGDELSIHLPHGEPRKSKFKVDGDKTPATIDLNPDYGVFKGRVCAGIYELDKNQLRICVIERGDRGRDPGTRPTAFKTEPRDGLILITLKRVK